MAVEMFVLRGKEIHLSKKDLERVAQKGIMGRGRAYFALIGGKRIPVKDLIHEALREKGSDVTLLDFTTQDAVRILRKLDVEIIEDRNVGTAKVLLKFAGVVSMGGDAVEDEGRLYE
ncbi:MAG: hypothetical protein ACRENZ_10530 [Thermodesulfobacteriota bacterium]